MNESDWGHASRPVRSTFWSAAVTFCLVACGGGNSSDPSLHPKDVESTRTSALAHVIATPNAAVASSRCATPVAQYATVSGLCVAMDTSPFRSMAAKAPIALAVASNATPDQVMDWAELALPGYFPDHQATIARTEFVFRYYPKADSYIGIKDDGSVYVHFGPLTESFRYVGQLADFTCIVSPYVCLSPTAVIAPRQGNSVVVGEVVLLDGRSSINPAGDTLNFAWSFTGRPVGSQSVINAGASSIPSFVPDRPGAYSVTLVVSNSRSTSTPATVTVTASGVNVAPVATLGLSQSVTTGMMVYLDGSGSSDADNDPLTYDWNLVSKPIGSTAVLFQNGPSSARPFFSADVPGTYVVGLSVSDGKLSSAAVTATITVSDAYSAVPPDVPQKVRQEYLAYSSPPGDQEKEQRVAVPWLNAIHDDRDAGMSRVDVDYLRAYCSNGITTQVVAQYEYGSGSIFEGDMYWRRPNWFMSGKAGAVPYSFDGSAGTAYFTPSSVPAAAWHIWGPRHDLTVVVPNASRCWVEARVYVAGPALVQVGLDYYENTCNPITECDLSSIEAGVSNWYPAANRWQVISLGKP